MGLPREIPLWSGAPPGGSAEPVTDVVTPTAVDDPGTYERVGRPSLFVYPSENPNGAATLLYPGGGYQHVAIGKGTGDIARQLNGAGITVFVLKYRLPQQGWVGRADVILQDGQRAIRIIRARATEWVIDRDRVAILGFSAGGYGAATLATHFDQYSYPPTDSMDEQYAKPVLAGLMFPVIALDRPFAHIPSRTAIVGADASPESAAKYSPDLFVSSQTPPIFLAHAMDDEVVRPENSLAMYRALAVRHNPVQLHLFQDGGHGLQFGTGTAWMQLFQSWCRYHEFI